MIGYTFPPLQPDGPATSLFSPAFPLVISFCPEILGRCMERLFQMLGAYWEEFRRPSESVLPSKCRGILAVTRASMLRAGQAMSDDLNSRGVHHVGQQLLADHQARFIQVMDKAIDDRHASRPGNIDSAIDALELASSLVKHIPWSELPWRDRDSDYYVLKNTVDRIKSTTHGWNDRVFAKLVREMFRLDPKMREDLIKLGWRDENA